MAADIGVDPMQQWKTEYKQQFKQDFATHLTRILALDPESAVPDGDVRPILHGLTLAAFYQARTYIVEKDPKPYNNELKHLAWGVYTDARIGGEKSFMQLLKEYHDGSLIDEEVCRQLDNIKAHALHLGIETSKALLRMMVVMNIEGREDLVKRFSDALEMLSFLKDAYEYWPGRNEHFGVVYNRIIVLMKHAHKEFILKVTKRSRMPAGSLGYIQNLKLDIDSKINMDSLVDHILNQTVQIISKLESHLSFAILPDGPRLLEKKGRSLLWLMAELEHLAEHPVMEATSERVKGLMSKYKNHKYYNDIETFLYKMYSLKEAMWEDLLSDMQMVQTSLSKGGVRLHVEAKIIKLHRKSALIRIVGINTREEAKWYIRKRIAYRYKNNVQKKKFSHYRCIWGKITRPHGDTGILHSKFKSGLVHAKTVRMWVYIGIG